MHIRKLLVVLFAAAIVANVAACAGGAAGTPKEPPVAQPDRTVTTEVLVVGGGGAGLSAAVEAATQGAKVVLIDKAANPGGTTMLAGGGIDAAGSRLQQEAGITVTPEQFAQDIFEYGERKGDRDLIDILANRSADAISFLEANGLAMKLANPAVYATRHQAEAGSTGAEIVKALLLAAQSKGVTIEVGVTAQELVVEDGKVVGVKAVDADQKSVLYVAQATILATGGFGANPEMLAQYVTDYPGLGSDLVARTATGDGLRMAREIGADLVAMGYVQAYPTVTVRGATLRGVEGAGAIMVNAEGKRFVNELLDNNQVSKAMVAQDGKVFLLFAGEYKEANENNVRAWGDQGILLAADTLEELADKMQVSYANLQATLDEYNEAVKQGTDARFGRARLPLTHEQPAYYALEIHAAAYTTLGGVKIDTNAQVLRSGQPIPGLYAAGEVAGGLFGTNKPGVTTATQNIVFGRLAADSAVKSLK